MTTLFNMRLLGRHKFPTDIQASQWLVRWATEIKNAYWQEAADVHHQFPSAACMGSGSFIFGIGSTGLEMEVSICFLHQVALVNEIRKRV